jgi:excinuclease UvrABC nuclease subunit
MSKKTVKFNTGRIQSLPNNRPVVYKILNTEGENIYTGVAKKGNVHDRLEDHLPGHRDAVPGASKVQIEQQPTIREAKQKEGNVISRSKPKYNQQE